ncbi:MAG TPA: hypothetical protein PLO55_13605 [Thermotogota bacterium]|nr:hypothetical protein [Thermotogota bacterium]HQQ67164.1 hypothetical protein [Thermotogota bacterium]
MKKLLIISLMVLVFVFATSGCYISLQTYPNITGWWTFVTGGTNITLTQVIHIWSENFGGLGGMTEGGTYDGNSITGTISAAKFGIPAKMVISFTDVGTGYTFEFVADLDETVLRFEQKMTGNVTRSDCGATLCDTFEAEWTVL